MRFLSASLLSLLITGTQALASGGAGNGEGLGLLTTFFIAFGVLIIVFQFLPGMAMFLGMLKGVFTSGAKKPHRSRP